MKATKLKVTDLMVGDWVYIKYYPMTAQPMQVKKDHFVRSLVEFKPIPLTPEILEKNGFVQDTNYSFRLFSPKVYKTRDIGVDFTIKGFTFWYGDTISIACGDGSRINRLPCCVHHLQHALKLCGIDKEIVV